MAVHAVGSDSRLVPLVGQDRATHPPAPKFFRRAPSPIICRHLRRTGSSGDLADQLLAAAIFSISQISCSSAGPRRPAVMMLVLSATGDPVAFVNRSVAMISFL